MKQGPKQKTLFLFTLHEQIYIINVVVAIPAVDIAGIRPNNIQPCAFRPKGNLVVSVCFWVISGNGYRPAVTGRYRPCFGVALVSIVVELDAVTHAHSDLRQLICP